MLTNQEMVKERLDFERTSLAGEDTKAEPAKLSGGKI